MEQRRDDPSAARSISFGVSMPDASIRPSMKLLQGSEEYFPELIAAVEDARTTVYLESYLIHDDPPTRRVLDALIRARQRGVAVFMLLDGFGAASEIGWTRTLLAEHGIQIEFYRPGVKWRMPNTWRRLHRKLALIDEQTAFVGGINLIGDHFDLVHGQLSQPRFDFAIRVDLALPVATISRVMRRTWWRVSLRNAFRGSLGRLFWPDEPQAEFTRLREAWRRTRRHLRWRAPRTRRRMSRRVRLLLRDNLRHRRDIERWYLVNISAARTEILIANAYFVPTYRFRQALLRATQRGVRVRLLIQGNSDQWWTHWATQALIGELVAGGVEVYEYTESFLHAKVAVIDDAVTVGSSNIDPFSLAFSLEANLIAEDVILANQLKQRLESAIYGASYRLQATRQPRGLLRSLGRAALITFALTALRVFIAFSGSSLRMR